MTFPVKPDSRLFSLIGILLIAAFLSCQAQPPAPTDPDYAAMSNEQLVEALLEIDRQAMGLHGSASANGFIVEDRLPKFAGGVMGSPPPASFEQMRELVRRGVDALPTLLAHVDDARPTKLIVGKDFQTWSRWITGYDPRVRQYKEPGIVVNEDLYEGKDRPPGPYTVRLGEVCYSLIGQIVGRNLTAATYLPTAGLGIASPVEVPDLAAKVRADWTGCSSTELKESLISEAMRIHPANAAGSLRRIRFYFPEDYQRLKNGELKDKIAVFEKEEAEWDAMLKKRQDMLERKAKEKKLE